jgi:hypothetical protein
MSLGTPSATGADAAAEEPAAGADTGTSGRAATQARTTDPASSSLSPTARTLWRSARGILAALLVLLLFAVVYAAVNSTEQYGPMDPRSPRADGARAVARLLAAEGVSVRLTTTTAGTAALAHGGDTTVLVTSPDLLDAGQLDTLRAAGAARIVLLTPGDAALDALAPGVSQAPADPLADEQVTNRQPGCGYGPAVRAGSAELGGGGYVASTGTSDACYSAGDPADETGYGLVRTSRTDGDTVVLGSASFLENSRLDQQGNASLALQLLGAHDHLLWYVPALGDGSATTAARQRGLLELLPAGWRWGLLQAGIAALLAALWRARRLGPVVPERLPVVVRAAETTEGRARLYRRAKARDRAAEALRQATRDRLAPLVGVRADGAPDALAAAVADRLPATPPGTGPQFTAPDVRDLLFGPPPTDDAGLLRLADRLDALERQVHHP